MAKALCLLSLVLSSLIALLFGIDFIMSMAGLAESAPLGAASTMMDLGFTIFGGALAVMSFLTFREQR